MASSALDARLRIAISTNAAVCPRAWTACRSPSGEAPRLPHRASSPSPATPRSSIVPEASRALPFAPKPVRHARRRRGPAPRRDRRGEVALFAITGWQPPAAPVPRCRIGVLGGNPVVDLSCLVELLRPHRFRRACIASWTCGGSSADARPQNRGQNGGHKQTACWREHGGVLLRSDENTSTGRGPSHFNQRRQARCNSTRRLRPQFVRGVHSRLITREESAKLALDNH